MQHERFEFGSWLVLPAERILSKDGEATEIEPKALDLLIYLLRHRDRVVGRPELLKVLWPDAVVSSGALNRCVWSLRTALRDDDQPLELIRTFYGKGLRFVAPVRASLPKRTREMFLGRRSTMAELAALMEAARDGRGSLALLTGEAGIGKTRVVEELARIARARGCAVWWGACAEGEGAPALWPWRQLLEAIDAECGPDVVADRHGSVLEALQKSATTATPAKAQYAAEARFVLCDRIGRVCVRAASSRPALVIVEDLHAADPSTLEVLKQLARTVSEGSLLVVATYRPPHSEADQAQATRSLAANPRAVEVPLGSLADEDIAELTAGIADQIGLEGTVHPVLVREIVALAEGNPFCAREIIRLHGVLGSLECPPSDGLTLPPTVRGIQEQRLAALPPSCRSALETASVIGRTFEASQIEAVAGSAPDLRADLDFAERAGLIEAIPGDAYRFCHALARRTIYECLGSNAAAVLHGRVVDVLEGTDAPADDAKLARLADHAYLAARVGDSERALLYARRAADACEAVCAWDEALVHRARAEALASKARERNPARELSLRIDLALAHERAGPVDRARDMYGDCAAQARALCDAESLARATIGWTRLIVSPEHLRLARSHLEEAYRLLPPDAAELRVPVCLSLLQRGLDLTFEERQRLAGEAQQLALRFGRERDLLSGADLLGVFFASDDVAAAVRRSTYLLESTDRDPWHALDVRLSAIGVLELALRQDIAEPAFHEVEIPEIPSAVSAHLALLQCGLAHRSGDFPEAQIQLDRMLHDVQQVGFSVAMMQWAGQRLWRARELGQARDVAGELDQLLSYAPHRPLEMKAIRILALVESGELASARRAIDAALPADFEALPRAEERMIIVAHATEACAAVGDRDRLISCHRLLSESPWPYVGHPALHYFPGPRAFYLGIAAAELGREAEAEASLVEAISITDRIGARPALARARLALATLLLRRGSAGDRERARAELDAAHASAREMRLGIASKIVELRSTAS